MKTVQQIMQETVAAANIAQFRQMPMEACHD